MKTSNVLASVLFGSLVAAAPLAKRDYVTKTQVVVETVVVYTTVWGDEPAASTVAAQATSQPGLFYEHPTTKANTPTPAYTPPAAKPSSQYTPPPASSAPAYTPPAQPTSQYTPPPVSSAAPQPSSVYTPPPAQVSSAAPAQTSASSGGGYGGGGNKHHGDITIYDNTGAAGACGESLTDDMPVVAIAKGAWNAAGGSTYDVQTGASTNSWCGQKITIQYTHPSGEVSTTNAVIKDMCPGCAGMYDIDLSHATWKGLGLSEITRLQADWWPSS